jgi:hypothetical protein
VGILGAGGTLGGAVGARTCRGLVAVVLEIFVLNCAVVLEDENTESNGGASGFTFFVEKVVIFAE